MQNIDYITWQEGKYIVSQCLNVDVASFGETESEAISNLREAVELHLRDNDSDHPILIDNIHVGHMPINA